MTKPCLLTCLIPFVLTLPAYADFISVGGGPMTRVNELTGAVQVIGSLSPGIGIVASLTRDPQTNTFYTVSGVQAGGVAQLFTVNPNTAQTTLVAPLSQSSLKVEALALAPNGLLYATSNNDNTLYTISPQTGFVASVGSMGSGFNFVYGLAFAPDGTLYGYTNINGEGARFGPGFFRLDPATATPTVLTPSGQYLVGLVGDMAFAPNGTLWASSGVGFGQLDIQTGASIDPIYITPYYINGMAFLPAAAVPEPTTFFLLGAGLLGLFALHRRNQSL